MKWLKKKNIFTQLAVMLLISLILLLVVFVNVLFEIEKEVENKEETYVQGVAEQLSRSVQQNYVQITKIMGLISFNKDVQDFLLTNDEAERMMQFIRVKNLMSDISSLNTHILDIVIVDESNREYRMGSQATYLLPQLNMEDGAAIISNPQKIEYYGETVEYIAIAQNIYSIDQYTQINSQIGELYLILTEDALTGGTYSANTSDNTIIQLVDGDGYKLWSNREEEINSKEFLKESIDSGIQNITIEIYQNGNSMLGNLYQWEEHISILYPILLVGLIIIWAIWTRSLIKPMYEVSKFLENMGDTGLDNLQERIQMEGYREIVMISGKINRMLDRIQDLTEINIRKNKAIYQEQVYAKQMELSYLRSQINPHFLYNTLETMSGIAYSENQPKLAEISRALGVIFKYSIKGKDIVPLKDELKIVKNYVLIQEIRFHERFVAEYDIDDIYLTQMIPKMILQPLVENAIIHGMEGRRELGHLKISVKIEEDTLIVDVIDDGVGISYDVMKELNENMNGVTQRESGKEVTRIGVLNVHNRIRLLFGEPYGLQIKSEPGKGTKVSVKLPVQEADS